MDEKTIRAMVAVCKAAFPLFPVAADTMRVYLDCLADLDASPDEALRAARDWILRHDKFPTIHDLRAACIAQAQARPKPTLLPPPPPSPEEASARLAEIRRKREEYARARRKGSA